MASTNKTTHYDLSQYVANDKPTYLVDYNQDMGKIDAGIYSAESKATVNAGAIGDLTDLDTTAKSDLVSAVNEVKGDVDTNTDNISTNTSNISTLGTNQGVMANLTTTAKDNLVNAINEVDAVNQTQNTNISNNTNAIISLQNLFKFTDFETVSNSSIVISGQAGGAIQTVGTLVKLAYNQDKSVFKIYGRIGIGSVTNVGSDDWKITLPTQLRPSEDFSIDSACVHAVQGNTAVSGNYYIGGFNVDKMTIRTNGNIEITGNLAGTNLGRNSWFYIPPCVYFNTDFGD